MTVCCINIKKYSKYLNLLILLFGLLILFFMTVSCENPTSDPALNTGANTGDSTATGDDESLTLTTGQEAGGEAVLDEEPAVSPADEGPIVEEQVADEGSSEPAVTEESVAEEQAGDDTVVEEETITEEQDSGLPGTGLLAEGTYALAGLIENGEAVIGYELARQISIIRLKVKNIEPGARVEITSHGVVDESGRESKIFYLVWSGSDNAINENKKSGGQKTYIGHLKHIKDGSFLDVLSDYLNFSSWYAYFEIKIIKDNMDITTSSAAEIIIW